MLLPTHAVKNALEAPARSRWKDGRRGSARFRALLGVESIALEPRVVLSAASAFETAQAAIGIVPDTAAAAIWAAKVPPPSGFTQPSDSALQAGGAVRALRAATNLGVGLNASGQTPPSVTRFGEPVVTSRRVSMQVSFSGPVRVNGRPTIGFTVADSARTLVYTGGSGKNVLTFTYRAAKGETLTPENVAAEYAAINLGPRSKITDRRGNPVISLSTPANIVISNDLLPEHNAEREVVGELSATNTDPADTITYSLVPGIGSADNARFTIEGRQLKANATFSYDTSERSPTNIYTIRVRATDSGGLFTERDIPITVTNVDETKVPLVITNVRLYDGRNPALTENATVVLQHRYSPDLRPSVFTDKAVLGIPVGYFIKSVLTGPVDPSVTSGARVIDGQGNILMPGLIESHYHLTLADLAQLVKVVQIIQIPTDADRYLIRADLKNMSGAPLLTTRLDAPNVYPSAANTLGDVLPTLSSTDAEGYLLDGGGHKIPKGTAMKDQLVEIGIKEATDMLLRGFTSIRDVAGHANEVKERVDPAKAKVGDEKLPAPRIWASQNAISSTGGHADFTHTIEGIDSILSEASEDDYLVLNEALGGFVADGVAEMLSVTRRNFVLGADFIKITPGGGVSSPYDPIDATTMTADEIKAVVEVANGFNTYVTAHAYEASTINLLIDCGVRMVEHATLIDDHTMARIHGINTDADPANDFYVNISPFFPNAFANVKQGEGAIKKAITETGTPRAYAYAKKYNLLDFVGFGSDVMYDQVAGAKTPKMLASLAGDINKAIQSQLDDPSSANDQFRKEMRNVSWRYTEADVLSMATSVNARVLALSGKRTPYSNEHGKNLTSDQIGVIAPGAVGDVILLRYEATNSGSELEQALAGFSNVDSNLLLVIKDGIVHKNTVSTLGLAKAFDSSRLTGDKAAHVSKAEFVSTMYQRIMGRLPSGEELRLGVMNLNASSDNRQAAITGLYDSHEFTTKRLSNDAFVGKVYSDLLGPERSPSESERSEALRQLENGLSRPDFAASIIRSSEFVTASQWV